MPHVSNSLKSHHSFLIRSPITLLISLSLLLAGCDKTVHETPQLRQVRAWIASQQHLPATTWTGTIQPSAEVSLQFRLDGKLATRPVDVGSRVKKGQIVATLTSSQSKEDRVATLAEYQEALAAELKGHLELERMQKLFAIGTASHAQLEEARASMATLTARKMRAQAQKSAALNESGFSYLSSPFNGVVTLYAPSPGQNVTAGRDIIKIASETMEVQFSLPVKMSTRLHTGDTVSVSFDGVSYEARVRYISPQLDNVTHTTLVRATLGTSSTPIVIGRAVTVSLKTSDKLFFPVPASSLTRSGNYPAVFVVTPGANKLELRKVVIERYTADNAWISEGLALGDRVVTAGINTLQDGEKVSVQRGVTK